MPRLQIDVGADLHAKEDAAWEALMAANDERFPEVMVRGNDLVRMTDRGALEPFSVATLSSRLSRVAAFGKWGANEQWSPKDPPRHVADGLIQRDSSEYPGAPRVERVVDVPVLTGGGELMTEPGHHPESQIYLRPAAGLEDLRVPGPDEASLEEVEQARRLLCDDLLGDFCFGDDASRANALAMLLTPFVRDYVDGPTPLFVVHAHAPGWGKDWLTDAALLPGCGPAPAKTPGAESDEEWRKRITSALRKAPAAVVLDNLTGTLDSPSLAAALTAEVWNDRILGESRDLAVPVRNVWTANGNNVGLSLELADRNVPVILAPRDGAAGDELVAPRHRPRGSWRHPDLPAWARENRARLVWASLVLVRHWLDGRVAHQSGDSFMREPEERVPPERSMGSFAEWAAVVGGVLAAAGVGGFLANRDRLASELADEDGDGTAEFLAAWRGGAADPATVPELAALCAMGGPLHDSLPDELAGMRDQEVKARLPYWLRERRGTWHGGHRLMRTPKSGGRTRWYVSAAG